MIVLLQGTRKVSANACLMLHRVAPLASSSSLAMFTATRLASSFVSTVVSNIATAYVNLAYAEKLRDVQRATLDQRERLVTLAKALASLERSLARS